MEPLAMDVIGWYIGTLHQLLGHDKASVVLGVPAGDKSQCSLCRFEANPTPQNRQVVVDAIGRGARDAL